MLLLFFRIDRPNAFFGSFYYDYVRLVNDQKVLICTLGRVPIAVTGIPVLCPLPCPCCTSVLAFWENGSANIGTTSLSSTGSLVR